jgi:beta-lactamase class A
LNDVSALISGSLTDFERVFAPSFLAAVTPEQIRTGVGQISATTGACTSIRITSRQGGYGALAEALTVNMYSIPVSITVEDKPPHKIIGLFLKTPVKISANFDSVIKDLSALPGSTSLCVVDIANKKVLAQKDTSRAQPIGSTFKLYVLGELARCTQAGTHRWSEVTAIQDRYKSMPTGDMKAWPDESPVTLHTLASLMISKSDNTATDHLLHFLGRQQVEAILAPMGHGNPALNIPFLSTADAFKLKFTGGGRRGRAYASMNVGQRRTMLESIATIPLDSINFTSDPIMPDSVEWFATTADLCRAMGYLSTAATTPAQAPLLGILGINRGIGVDQTTWPVVGYKGGSETGVLNMTYYLQRKDGRQFALSCSWVRTDKELDLDAFSAIVGGAIRVLASQ